MKNILTTLLVFLVCIANAQTNSNIISDISNNRAIVFFNLNSYSISTTNKALLDSLVLSLQGKEFSIQLIGHTDSLGNENKNLTLSMRRCNKVKEYLHYKGLDTSKISVKYFGELKPVFANSSEETIIKNRCVEVIVNTVKPPKNYTLKEEPSITTRFENGTIITCKNGAQIIISPEAFYPHKISEIEFNISEEYSVCDILQSTSTLQAEDGNCLSSAGMIYIKPTLDKVEIQPNKGQMITIKIPLMGGRPDPRMKVYFAKKDSTGKTVWQLRESELTYENVGTQYYVFRVDTLIGFNLDRPMGIMCQKNGPRIKVKNYKNAEVFQTYPDEVYLSRGEWNKKKKVFVIDSVIISKKPQITILAYNKEGFPVVAKVPFESLKYNRRKKYYSILPTCFEPLKSVTESKQTVKDALCNYMKK